MLKRSKTKSLQSTAIKKNRTKMPNIAPSLQAPQLSKMPKTAQMHNSQQSAIATVSEPTQNHWVATDEEAHGSTNETSPTTHPPLFIAGIFTLQSVEANRLWFQALLIGRCV